jgi:PIN domain nuclease of toxin-antitoxin system
MNQFVTDTHPLVWHLTGCPNLSPTAKQIFEQADRGECRVIIPAIVLVEIIYLAERWKVEPKLVDELLSLLEIAPQNYAIAPLDIKVIAAMRAIDVQKIPDMPDRIIVATAKVLNAPLISRDLRITQSGLVTVVW